MSKKIVKQNAFLRYVLVGRYRSERKHPKFVKVIMVFYLENEIKVICDAQKVLGFLDLPKRDLTDYRINEKAGIFHCLDIFGDIMIVTGGYCNRGRKRRGLAFHHELKEKLVTDPKIKKRKLLGIIQKMYDSPDLIERCKEKIDDIQMVMEENIDKQLRNMEKVEDLQEDAENLYKSAKKFNTSSKKLSAAAALLSGVTGAICLGLSGTMTGAGTGLVVGAPLGLSIGLGITAATGGFDGGSATVATVVLISAGSALAGGVVGTGLGVGAGAVTGAMSGGAMVSAPMLSEGVQKGSQKFVGLIYDGVESDDEDEDDEF